MAVQERRRRFTSIIQFWAQLFSCFTSNYKTPHLPDNVIFEILSRLPARRVSVFRRVCKKWLELTSTIDFAHTNLERQNGNTEKVLLFQLDNIFYNLNKEANGRTSIVLKETLQDLNITTEDFPIICGSCNGIISFNKHSHDHKNYLLNPATHERINIRCNGGFLCGFFYNSLKKEYVLLFARTTLDNGMASFFLYSLETESIRNVGTFHYSSTEQVYSNGSLYWMIDAWSNNTCQDSVMAFKVETEVFSSFPHPDKQCGPTCQRTNMRLLENSGQLLFCRVHEVDYINLWVLENVDNNTWVKRYVVHLDWDLKLYPFISYPDKENMKSISVLNVDNGELFLCWGSRGYFLYNLDEKKVRKIHHENLKLNLDPTYFLSAISYMKSLVSLKVSAKHPNSGKFPTYGHVTIDLE